MSLTAKLLWKLAGFVVELVGEEERERPAVQSMTRKRSGKSHFGLSSTRQRIVVTIGGGGGCASKRVEANCSAKRYKASPTTAVSLVKVAQWMFSAILLARVNVWSKCDAALCVSERLGYMRTAKARVLPITTAPVRQRNSRQNE